MVQKIKVKFSRLVSVGNFSNIGVGVEIEESDILMLNRRRKRAELWKEAREFVNEKILEEKRNSLMAPKGPLQRSLTDGE